MQKKLIALAVAGLISAPVFAESNVTVYGILDFQLNNLSESVSDADTRTGVDNALGQSGNRLGFKGTEDLGNGLKASFVLEAGSFQHENKAFTWGRQYTVALSGGFGTVQIGRQKTPHAVMLDTFDPFGTGTVGNGSNIYGEDGLPDYRLDNLIAYVSPSFGGFNVIAGYTFQAAGDETGQDGDLRVFAINPNYKAGALAVSFNYHQIDPKGGDDEITVWDLAASYDFGMFKLQGMGGKAELDNALDVTRYMIGGSVKVSDAGSVIASYASTENDEIDDSRASQFAIGYDHKLSKRTNVYATYATIDNDDNASAYISGDYERGFQVGLRHKF